jgi:hypothetical protein
MFFHIKKLKNILKSKNYYNTTQALKRKHEKPSR